MNIVINVRTPAQAAAIVLHAGLNRRQQRQLLTEIARSTSVPAIIAVAHLLGPKLARVACGGESRLRLISTEDARKLLVILPATAEYKDVRDDLLGKFLRQPFRDWIMTSIGIFWSEGVREKEYDMATATSELARIATVVLASRLPEFAYKVSFLEHGAIRHIYMSLDVKQRDALSALARTYYV